MALKLDMSKAYDRIKWKFLEKIMRHLGFSGEIRTTIMSCIRSISYVVLLNRELVGHIKPDRALRQGDPLSPYMFLLCAMGLQSLLYKAKFDGLIWGGGGVSICRNGPRVSHLLFMDDSILLCRSKEFECPVILDLLVVYEKDPDRKSIKTRQTFFFSSNTHSVV